MASRNYFRWQMSFAAVQALGAIVAVVSFLLPSNSPWTRLVWLILAVTLVGVCIGWFVNAQSRAAEKSAETEPLQVAEPTRNAAQRSSFAKCRIHCLVPLSVWSALASVVVIFMSSDLTALFLVALAPIWIGLLTFGATKVSRHRPSVITMAVLCCGFFGAWLGSAGDSATRLGFLWYSLAGYIVSRALVYRDATVNIVTAAICTALFVLLTGLVMGRYALRPLLQPSGFIRDGAPLFALEAYLVLSGRWMVGAWLTRRAAFKDSLTPSGLPE